MQFNVAQLLKAPVGSSRRYTINHTFDRLSDTNTDHASGRVTMVRTDRGIWVSGTLEASATSTCSRCLTVFPHGVRFQVDEEYVPTVDIVTGQSVTVADEENGTFTTDEHHTLDLTEAVRQYTVIHMPMKPLCRPDCLGLCQRCGANLNEGACQCPETAGDPRWGVLKEMLAPKKGRTR